jgi:hypothetical protein
MVDVMDGYTFFKNFMMACWVFGFGDAAGTGMGDCVDSDVDRFRFLATGLSLLVPLDVLTENEAVCPVPERVGIIFLPRCFLMSAIIQSMASSLTTLRSMVGVIMMDRRMVAACIPWRRIVNRCIPGDWFRDDLMLNHWECMMYDGYCIG